MKKTPGNFWRSMQRFKLRESSWLLLKASIVANFGISLLAPVYAIFVQHIGGSILDAGIAYAIFCIITGILVMFLGTSKFFQKKVKLMIVIGYILLTVSYASYIFIRTPMQLFLVQIIMGFSHGILEPAWDAVYAERLSEKEECKTWSMWTGTTNLAIGVAAILGSLIVSKYSFNSLFIIMTIFCALSTLISLRILRKVKRKN